jgi:hypothetical protein
VPDTANWLAAVDLEFCPAQPDLRNLLLVHQYVLKRAGEISRENSAHCPQPARVIISTQSVCLTYGSKELLPTASPGLTSALVEKLLAGLFQVEQQRQVRLAAPADCILQVLRLADRAA